MISRPPTARPKTSAGPRVTSARLRQTSNSTIQNITERSDSRTTMAPEPTAPTAVARTASQAGAVPPSRQNMAVQSERTQSRMGTRPITDTNFIAPPGTAMRPVTQQGLTGVRVPTRSGAGRFVVDKNYYVSLLRAQISNLVCEIHKLRDELNKCERDRQSLLIYEEKAEEEANTIRTLQGRLLDCNKVVDLMNTHSELREIENELTGLHEQNIAAERTMNELFEDRRTKEEAIRKLEKDIEEQKAHNSAVIHSMDPIICDEYEQMKRENDELLEKYKLKQEQFNELNRKKEQLDEELANSPLKQQAMILYERLAELGAKKSAIVDEISAEGLPDEQRDRLLQIVIRTTDEINTIQKQLDSVNEQIEQANEELREFGNELETVIGEKNEKYRELKVKEMEMDEFLDSYESFKAEEELRINKASDEVIRILEVISTNSTSLDLSSYVSGLDVTGLQSNKNASASELKELHIRLQEELLMMAELEERLEQDNKHINERMNEIAKKILEFENIDALKSGTEQKRQELEHRCVMLEQELPQIENSCKKVLDELRQKKSALGNNDEYIKLKNVQKKWQYVEQSVALLREVVAQREAETNYQDIKEEALRLKAEYNTLLITSMKPY